MSHKVYNLMYSLSRLRMKHKITAPDEVAYVYGVFRSLLSSSGGVKEIGPLTLTYGRTIQAFLASQYAGLQCTSMALTAIIQNKIYDQFSPRQINNILDEGNRLHTFLRDKIRVSDQQDGKIAIEDLPHRSYLNIGKVFERETAVRLIEECQNVFTSKREDFGCFLTIREYLEKWQMYGRNRLGFLLTIREASYAVIVKRNGKAVLFDSHGHLKINDEMIKEKAGALSFPSLGKLEEFIIGMYGLETHAAIAPVSVSFTTKPSSEITLPRKVKHVQPEYMPYFPEVQESKERMEEMEKKSDNADTADKTDDIDDTSAFIGLMGGGY